MKKNYSQKFMKDCSSKIVQVKNSSVEKIKQNQSPMKKAFSRKPSNTYIPLTRKKQGQSLITNGSVVQPVNYSQLVQKSKQMRFVSSRSQTSLNSSQISKSSTSLSIANSKTQQIDEEIQYSTFLPSQSYSPEKQNNQQRQIFRRKTVLNSRTPILNKNKTFQNNQQNNNTDSRITATQTSNRYRKVDMTEPSTKIQSSQFSDMSKSCVSPPSQSVIRCNLVRNQKHSSKDSLRKSNSSNSVIKKQGSKSCQQCQYHVKQTKQLNIKLQRLERILKNKDQEISNLNKKINEVQKKNKEFEKKIKEFQKFDYEGKIKLLEEELRDNQEDSTRIKDSLSKAIQELKYKNVQNSTLKKFQAQCQGLQRKCQMLVCQRNQLRDQVSNKKISKSSYIHYPSASRQSKLYMKNLNAAQNDRTTYTSREQQQFDDSQQTHSTTSGFKKKKYNHTYYEQSSQSEIISLSQQSNF